MSTQKNQLPAIAAIESSIQNVDTRPIRCSQQYIIGATGLSFAGHFREAVKYVIQNGMTNTQTYQYLEDMHKKSGGAQTMYACYKGLSKTNVFKPFHRRIVVIVCSEPKFHPNLKEPHEELEAMIDLIKHQCADQQVVIDIFTDLPVDHIVEWMDKTNNFYVRTWKCTAEKLNIWFLVHTHNHPADWITGQDEYNDLTMYICTGAIWNTPDGGEREVLIGFNDHPMRVKDLAMLIAGLRLDKLVLIADFCFSAKLTVALMPMLEAYGARDWDLHDFNTSDLCDYIQLFFDEAKAQYKKQLGDDIFNVVTRICADTEEVRAPPAIEDAAPPAVNAQAETAVVVHKPRARMDKLKSAALTVLMLTVIVNGIVFMAQYGILYIGFNTLPQITHYIGRCSAVIGLGAVFMLLGPLVALMFMMVASIIASRGLSGYDLFCGGFLGLVSFVSWALLGDHVVDLGYVSLPFAPIFVTFVSLYVTSRHRNFRYSTTLCTLLDKAMMHVFARELIFGEHFDLSLVVCKESGTSLYFYPLHNGTECRIYSLVNTSAYVVIPATNAMKFNRKMNAYYTCDRDMFMEKMQNNCSDYSLYRNHSLVDMTTNVHAHFRSLYYHYFVEQQSILLGYYGFPLDSVFDHVATVWVDKLDAIPAPAYIILALVAFCTMLAIRYRHV